MEKIYLILTFCYLTLSLNAQSLDSICGRKLIRNSNSEVLGWFNPQIPGASYNKVVKLATDFIINTPIEPKTGLPMYLVTCCFDGPHMTPRKNVVAVHWPNNPACNFAGMVQSLAIRFRTYSGDTTCMRIVQNMLDFQL